MSAEQNKALIRSAIEAFQNPEARDAYFELYDPDCVFHGFPPGLPPGVEGFKQFYQLFFAAFPDAHIDVEDMIGEGDQVAARYTIRGTHQGAFMNLAPTGTPVAVRGATVLRFDNGKCVERWQYFDEMSLLQQLGALPPPSQ